MKDDKLKAMIREMIASHYRSVLTGIEVTLTVMEKYPEYKNELLLEHIGAYLSEFIEKGEEND